MFLLFLFYFSHLVAFSSFNCSRTHELQTMIYFTHFALDSTLKVEKWQYDSSFHFISFDRNYYFSGCCFCRRCFSSHLSFLFLLSKIFFFLRLSFYVWFNTCACISVYMHWILNKKLILACVFVSFGCRFYGTALLQLPNHIIDDISVIFSNKTKRTTDEPNNGSSFWNWYIVQWIALL